MLPARRLPAEVKRVTERIFNLGKNGYMQDLTPVVELLEKERHVEFAYIFGSQATGEAGPLSDLDIAVHLDRRADRLTYRLKLMERLAKLLKRNDLDLVVLNEAPPLLSHEVIKYGTILKEHRPKRVPYEARVISNYLDTASLRQMQRAALAERVRKGTAFGP